MNRMQVRPAAPSVTAPPLPAAAALEAGLAQHRASRLDAAAAQYRQALAADPGHAEALRLLGLTEYQLGRPAEAAGLIGRSLARAPDNPGAHNNLALALMQLGRNAEAVASCDRAVALRPEHVGALSNRGIALRALGRPAEAAASQRRALVLRPDLPEAHMNLGLALADLGQAAEALACHERALALRPEFAEALCNQGVALLALERFAEALASLDQAAALRPDLADIHCNRGNALRKLERLEEALASYDRALALRPDYAEALANRALVLVERDQPDLALESVERALALDPAMAEAHATRAAALRDLGRFAEARESHAQALQLAPGNGRFALYLAVSCLRVGRLVEGWHHYERRWDGEDFYIWKRTFPQPRWRGETLAGQTLLVHADQGFGDAIQFSRYLPLLAGSGRLGTGRVVFEVHPALRSLLADIPGPAQVLATRDALPPFDVHCALADLPGIFATDLAGVPPVHTLRPEPERARAWAARMPQDGRLRVGLAWSGSRDHKEDRARTMNLALLRPLAGCGAAFQVVHKDVRETDFAELAGFPDLVHLSAGFGDFADTAAALSQLDLVISVDTSVAHLAATLGRPTWIMLPYVPDWRWLLDREDSPWYPAIRLFRQRRRGDWAEVVARVAVALRHRIAQHAGGR